MNSGLAAGGLTAGLQTKYETRVGYLGFTWFLGSKEPTGTLDNQPQLATRCARLETQLGPLPGTAHRG